MAVAKEQIRQIISDIGSHKNSANIFVTGETMEKMGIFSCKELIW